MTQTISPRISYPDHGIAVVAEAIRAVSARARTIPIAADSFLLEDLALDSLYLVAVILRLQDHFQVELDPDLIPNLRQVTDLVSAFARDEQAAA